MRIVYKKSIREKLAETIHNVKLEGKDIDYIGLTQMEWLEFSTDYAHDIRPPYTFMGTTLRVLL